MTSNNKIKPLKVIQILQVMLINESINLKFNSLNSLKKEFMNIFVKYFASILNYYMLQSSFYSLSNIKNDTLTKIFNSITHSDNYIDKTAKLSIPVSHFFFIFFVTYTAIKNALLGKMLRLF
jgi:hypothetical protein